jgi:hypothetical protein
MYLIVESSSGMPAYYSIEVGRKLGASHGWTNEREQALQFVRERDARNFTDTFLPNVAPFATIQHIAP